MPPSQQRNEVYKVQKNNLWQQEDAMALPLLVSAMTSFGTELFTWSPLTIAMEIKDEFGMESNPVNFDKLMSAILVLTTDLFYHSLPDFCKICLSLSGEPEGFIPDSEDCAWGITEALLINPPQDENTFSEEIKSFIGQVLNQDGILNPPDVLRIALRDKGELLAQLKFDYSDDPEMFEAIAGFEQDKAETINSTIKSRTRLMLEQLRDMPIASEFKENASRVANKLLARLETI